MKIDIKSFIKKIQAQVLNPYNLKLSLKEKINLLDQLSNLLNSGIPITNSFTIIMYQTKDKKMKAFLSNILELLNKGEDLKDVCKRYPHVFSIFDLSIIEMGEVTGKLADAVETIKIKEEKNRELKGKIIGALIYPMVITTLSVMMIFVFMIYVIPKIQAMYSDAKVNLPELTQAVITTSIFLQNNIIELCIGFILFLVGIITFKSHPKTKIYFDKFVLHVPIFGNLIRKKTLALLSSSLGILLSSGVIINKSLEISSKALENDYYEKELNRITLGVSKGVELSHLMGVDDIKSGKENPLFPIELASVVKIGEQTGKLSSLLTKISKKYNKEIDEVVKNIGTAIEPIVIIVVGGIIGTLIMAIMLPFFNMVNVI